MALTETRRQLLEPMWRDLLRLRDLTEAQREVVFRHEALIHGRATPGEIDEFPRARRVRPRYPNDSGNDDGGRRP